jgi:hypothetical protein
MTVQYVLPSCAEAAGGSQENANSTYGPLQAGPSNTITQTFGVAQTSTVSQGRPPRPGPPTRRQ